MVVAAVDRLSSREAVEHVPDPVAASVDDGSRRHLHLAAFAHELLAMLPQAVSLVKPFDARLRSAISLGAWSIASNMGANPIAIAVSTPSCW